MRIEEFDGATLYCAKAEDVIDIVSEFDAVISDPPYGISGSSGTINLKAAKGNYAANFEDTPEYIEKIIAPTFAKYLQRAKRGAVTTGHKCNGYYPSPCVIGGFFQPAATGMCIWGSNNFQPIFFYGRDPRIGKKISPIAIPLNEAAPKNGHPCPKPENAWTWLVDRVALTGETVIDPFMGSGTTGVSCNRLGINFIGIELEETYFDIACRRIENAIAQPKLFAPAVMKKENIQSSLLK